MELKDIVGWHEKFHDIKRFIWISLNIEVHKKNGCNQFDDHEIKKSMAVSQPIKHYTLNWIVKYLIRHGFVLKPYFVTIKPKNSLQLTLQI